MKRRVVILLIALFLVGVAVIAWTLAELPPVRYVLRYGLSPGCVPTGQTLEFEGVTFVEIGPGISRMGSTHLVESGDCLGRLCAPLGLPWGMQPEPSDEMPVHWVEFRRGFWIARTEVTNAQYERFDPEHERSDYTTGVDDVVGQVSWLDARQYCAWLSEKAGRIVRLPSEAEWECACRAGSSQEYCFGDDEKELDDYSRYGDWWREGGCEVATRRPNRWGLYDMHGNVREWCEDTAFVGYSGAPLDGSAWVKELSLCRAARGGYYVSNAEDCRSAARVGHDPELRSWCVGFRPALSPLPE